MPYFKINLSQKLTPEQKEKLWDEIDILAEMLPGKEASKTLVILEDGLTMRLRGKQENIAYVDVRYRGSYSIAVKQKFVTATAKVFNDLLGVPEEMLYLTLLEFECWGVGNELRAEETLQLEEKLQFAQTARLQQK